MSLASSSRVVGLSAACLALASLSLGACGDDGGADGGGGAGTSQGASGDGANGASTTQGNGGDTASSGTNATGGASGPGVTSTSTGTTSGTGGGATCGVELPTFADGTATTRTIFVDGNAGPGGDGSAASPFANLWDAEPEMTPGTLVSIAGDVQGQPDLLEINGTAEAPIVLRGEPGARLVGSLAAGTPALWLTNSSYVVVEDLELLSSSAHVLHFFFTDHMLFRRLVIHDAGLGAIKASQSSQVFIEEVDAFDAGNTSDHPVIDYVGVNGGHVVRSAFHQGPGVIVMLKGGTSDLLFAWNDVYDQVGVGNVLTLGQSTGPEFFQPSDAAFEGLRIVAFANRVHDADGAPFAFEGCKDCAFVHNVAWNVRGNQLVRFLPGAAGLDSGLTRSIPEGCRFTGNVVVGGQAGGATLNADAENTGPGNVIDHNVFLKPGEVNWWGVVNQDLATNTFDQDPALDAEGRPASIALVDATGADDVAALPFGEVFVRDFGGDCATIPLDRGAFDVP